MGLYEGIKDAIGIAQKADNFELYKQLIDLSSQALDMQTEIAKLREENSELQKSKETEQRFVRHEQPYLTLEGDNQKVCYCAVCWGKDEKMIQMDRISWDKGQIKLYCSVCENHCIECCE